MDYMPTAKEHSEEILARGLVVITIVAVAAKAGFRWYGQNGAIGCGKSSFILTMLFAPLRKGFLFTLATGACLAALIGVIMYLRPFQIGRY